MPKLKTSSSISKRFKITIKGKILRNQAGKNHLLQKKSSKRKNKLSRTILIKKQDAKAVKFKLVI